jgi:hypothetical protein
MSKLKLEHYEKNGDDDLVYNLTFVDEETGSIYHGQVELYFCDEGCN